MSEILNIESDRCRIQHLIDSSRTKLYRNQMGQFATPNDLALEILISTKQLFDENQKISFLDPAIGTGSFYSAFLQVFNLNNIDFSYGIEIDDEFASTAQSLWSSKGLEVINADFTKLTNIEKKVDLLICNPPYVRHHHINESDKSKYVEFAKSNLGINVSKLAGLYCHFIFHAHRFLKDNGIGVWLIPNEFLDVNYGIAVKQYLLDKVELIRIHRFNPEIVKFSDALVSSSVLWFRNKKSEPNNNVKFTFGDSISNPQKEESIKLDNLNPSEKWSTIFHVGQIQKESLISPKIKDLFKIKRGIATGNNEFFILSEQEIEKRNLPKKFFKPILPSPKFITKNIIEANKDGNTNLPVRYYVLDCNLSFGEISNQYQSLADYINSGELNGISSGYICRNRTPWYSQERRESPLFVCNYIGRENSSKAFRFILNKSESIVTNSYLGMYPNPNFYKLQESDPNLSIEILELLNSISSEELINKGRVYGGGMYKLEPKELENVDIRVPIKLKLYNNPTKQLTLFEPKKNYAT